MGFFPPHTHTSGTNLFLLLLLQQSSFSCCFFSFSFFSSSSSSSNPSLVASLPPPPPAIFLLLFLLLPPLCQASFLLSQPPSTPRPAWHRQGCSDGLPYGGRSATNPASLVTGRKDWVAPGWMRERETSSEERERERQPRPRIRLRCFCWFKSGRPFVCFVSVSLQSQLATLGISPNLAFCRCFNCKHLESFATQGMLLLREFSESCSQTSIK